MKHSCHHQPLPTKLRQDPALTGSSGRPHAQLRPRGLLCASQTRSDAAKEQRNVKDNFNSKYLSKALHASAAELGLAQRGSVGEERESRHS